MSQSTGTTIHCTMIQAIETGAKGWERWTRTTRCIAFGRIQPCDESWMGDSQSCYEFKFGGGHVCDDAIHGEWYQNLLLTRDVITIQYGICEL